VKCRATREEEKFKLLASIFIETNETRSLNNLFKQVSDRTQLTSYLGISKPKQIAKGPFFGLIVSTLLEVVHPSEAGGAARPSADT